MNNKKKGILKSPLMLQWIAFLSFLTITVWAFIIFDLSQLYKYTVSQGRTQNQNIARIYAEEVVSSIGMVDYVLRDLREQWKKNQNTFATVVQSRQVHLDPSIAFHVFIVDSNGKMRFSSLDWQTKPIIVSDRSYFNFHRATKEDALHISEPVIGRLSSRWVIQFTRPLKNASGQFNGVIAISVSPEYFSRFQKALDIGNDSSISLVRQDGSILVRFPNPELALGKTLDNAPFLRQNSPPEGFFQETSRIDQVERFSYWKNLDIGGLVVVIGQSVKALFKQYEHQRRVYILSGLALSCIFLLIGSSVYLYLRRREEARSAMLAMEKSLQRSQKLEAVGKLTGGVTHDFNNILQIISSNIEMLEIIGGGNALIEERLRSMSDAVGRGAKLSSQLLAFARRQPLQPQVIHVGHQVKGIDDLIKKLVGSAIEVKIQFHNDLWNVKADPSLLENVILNLAANARDAMNGKGSITIHFRNIVCNVAQENYHPEIKEGEYVCIDVTDTGTGMPPEVIEHAFDPFFTTKPEGKGTGLGLSMAYGFVKQSGGYIYISSKLGSGTTIQILLPRSLEHQAQAQSVVSQSPLGGTATILIVEDDLKVQSIASELLSKIGYRILAAGNADQALRILEQNKTIDLVFTDIIMPGTMDGLEFVEYLRRHYPELPILITSGHIYEAIRDLDRLEPNIYVLEKPYSRGQLGAAIHELLA